MKSKNKPNMDIRMRKALSRSSKKTFSQGNAAEEAGFSYDAKQDIFYSVKNPWQKRFGYFGLYDAAAPLMNCVFDSEPVYFTYDGRRWLIEFWKGQYGMTTGCEIGVYVKNNWFYPLYRGVENDEYLQISMTLVKNGKVLFTRQEKHWWLTGFVLGEYSEPEELKMSVRITLKTKEMCRVFKKALGDMGYHNHKVLSDGKTVAFVFGVPYSSQPLSHSRIGRAWVQSANKEYCDLYHSLEPAARQEIFDSIVRPDTL